MKFSRIALLMVLFVFVSCAGFSPYQATSNPVGTKRGSACSTYVLGFHMSGENHIHAAAMAGNITKIGTVDTKSTGFWPFYHTHCTYVSGM